MAHGRSASRLPYFYPRPPRGGRLAVPGVGADPLRISIHALREEGDKPAVRDFDQQTISIHALREEGDRFGGKKPPVFRLFLSTPSARRATCLSGGEPQRGRISIHALREEGDPYRYIDVSRWQDFYPRPPRGGRQRPAPRPLAA